MGLAVLMWSYDDPVGYQEPDLIEWVKKHESISIAAILKNIGPAAGASDGLIIASPSTQDPDYYVS